MKRRELLKSLAALPIVATAARASTVVRPRKLIRPRRLRPGQTVALIAPSSGLSKEQIDRAVENMKALGLVPKLGKYAAAANGFLAGTDAERVADIHWAFTDDSIDAVWCLRGGYGLTRILPDINYELIRRNPKLLIGYSDITALLVAVYQRSGLVTAHGPASASTFSDYTKGHVTATLFDAAPKHAIAIAPENASNVDPLYKTEVIKPGIARGQLVGGNLSLISAMAGTPYALKDIRGKILFLEDVGEKPYRVDRMLTQLLQSIHLRQLAGIALGIFSDCNGPEGSPTVMSVCRERLGKLGVPVVYGLSFGHIRDQFTLPLGVRAELDATNSTLTLLEAAVI
jgi:muramoyltetrapeptide carboxypeptidase